MGEGTVFANPKGAPISDIRDGTSNTIMTLEVDDTHAVLWTKPDDLDYDSKEPLKGLGGLYGEGFNAGYLRRLGAVHLQEHRPEDPPRRLMTASGGEVTEPF